MDWRSDRGRSRACGARFLPVTANGDCLKHVQGLWYHPHYRTAFEIRGNRVHIGVGPAAQTGTLSPLGQGRMLVECQDGPWLNAFASISAVTTWISSPTAAGC